VNLSPNAFHRLLPFALAALFGLASPAIAQDAHPLAGCKNPSFSFVGPTGVVPGTKAQFVSGEVHLECSGTSIDAEYIEWDDKIVRASGDVLVMQDGLRINADRMEMDRHTKLGTFFNAYGTARLSDAPVERSLFGAMEPEVWFQGERIERIGPRSYRLTKGSFSTCVQANPRWVMGTTSATIVLDEYAVLKHMQFRVKGVPVFYFPYIYYPLKKEDRATGFLLPTYSTTDVRGQGISNAFFWAISRSQDATFYYDYYSKAGQGGAVDYRYAAAQGSRGDLRVRMFMEKERLALDGTVLRPGGRSFDVVGQMNQSLGRYFQLIGRVNYFTDVATQQLYQQDTYDFSNRNRLISMTLSGNVKRLNVRAMFERNDVFTGITAQGRTVLPLVSLGLSDSPLGRARVLNRIYFGASGEVGNFELRDPNRPQPELGVRRLHGLANLSASLSNKQYLRFSTKASVQATRWLDSLDPLTGLPVPVPISRNLLTVGADLVGPILERRFQTPNSGYAEYFTHRIEPSIRVSWVSPFDRRTDIIQVDQLDLMAAGLTTVNYSLTNRISARKKTVGGAAFPRDVVTVSLSQSYYTDPVGGVFDPQYPTGSTGHFTPIELRVSVAPTNEVTGSFQAYIDAKALAPRSYSAMARVDVPRLQLAATWSRTLYVPGVVGFNDPNGTTQAIGATTTLKTVDGRFGGTYGFNLDVKTGNLLQQRIIAHYNAQCCGIAVDYQVIGVSRFVSSLQADRRLAITFTLAGIGAFSYPLGGFGR